MSQIQWVGDLPKEPGADDLQDSARLAGVMRTFGYAPRDFDISEYLVDKRYVRHPQEKIYDFSRDQAICLVAGLYFSGLQTLVRLEYIDGIDFFLPHHRGHVKRCAGLKTNILEDLFLWADVLWGSIVSPRAEQNKRLCMLMVAPPKYMKTFLFINTEWRESISDYWDSWRGMKELSDFMIAKLEKYGEEK